MPKTAKLTGTGYNEHTYSQLNGAVKEPNMFHN